MEELYYKNEDDRCYGLAGMSLSLSKFGALDRISSVSIDADGPMVTFSHSYYFTGSPTVSPKSAWKILLDNYYITMGMVVANVMARRIVHDRSSVGPELLEAIYEQVLAEGRDTCSLEEEEVRRIFDSTVNKLYRLFSNSLIRPRIDELARIIARRRTLSGMEMHDEMYNLDLL